MKLITVFLGPYATIVYKQLNLTKKYQLSSTMTPMLQYVLLIVFSLSVYGSTVEQYEPTWESLDSRPLPQWFDEAKFGIFIHWGVFSVPSFGSEWFWQSWKGSNSSAYINFMKQNYPPEFSYQDFGHEFTTEFYNPDDWAEMFKNSGAKYVVLTSKHHEGYTLWPSKYSFSWNSMDVGPHRDLLGDLADSIRSKTDLRFGLYHSLYEWFNPLYILDKESDFQSQLFVRQKTIPELYELVETYKPDVIWSDGDWEASDAYWTSKDFLAWLYNESPVKDSVVVNDRWGKETSCKHGGFYSCADRYNPGILQPHKWENCMTIDKQSWGYRRNARLSDFLSTHDLVKELVTTVSCGGNLLMNVGPTKDGMIPAIFEERLRDMGSWLQVNGDAIYATKPWIAQNDTVTNGVWYTMSGENVVEPVVYATVLNWPTSGKITLGVPKLTTESQVTMLGYEIPLEWSQSEVGAQVVFPEKSKVASNWAWTLRMTYASARAQRNHG